MRLGISNSEVNQWNKCQLAWLRGYHPQSLLAKKSFGPARTRGIIAHSSLETFYALIKEGETYDDAVEEAMYVIREEQKKASAMSDGDKMEMLRRLYDIMGKYYVHYKDDVKHWEVISTENFHAMEAGPDDDFYLPMRLDMVIYQRSGKYAGEISPVDHKTTNDWWSKVMLNLNSQLPLYIRALKENGFKGHPTPVIRRGIFNFIRTRDIKDPFPAEIFQRQFVVPKAPRIENVYKNHLKIAREIVVLKKLPFAEALDRVKWNLDTNSCKYCDFSEICEVTIEDEDPRFTLAASYERNTYGYKPLEMLDSGQ
jgi:hypothetical protein